MNITTHASAGFEPGSLFPSLLCSLRASGSGSCLVLPTEDTYAEGRLKRFLQTAVLLQVRRKNTWTSGKSVGPNTSAIAMTFSIAEVCH